MAGTYNEQDLVRALKERENQAFAYLYDQHSAALFGIILQIVQNTDSASDILQEVFVKVWRKIESYDATRGRLFTWMLNIARNASVDMIRSKTYQNSRKNQNFPENAQRPGPPGTQAGIMDIGLEKVLGKLKPDLHNLMQLAYFKGYTYEQIAASENLPPGAVKARIRNALLQLRELLK